jgi:hypothetical protein
MLELPFNFNDSMEYVIYSDEGFWSNTLGWCSDESSADGYMGSDIKEHNYNLPVGNNVRMVKRRPQNRNSFSDKESWTQVEKICYIAHMWVEKEGTSPCLQDFDYTDMSIAAQQFIRCQPDTVIFITHIENCFDALVAECENKETPEWTTEYFTSTYPNTPE